MPNKSHVFILHPRCHTPSWVAYMLAFHIKKMRVIWFLLYFYDRGDIHHALDLVMLVVTNWSMRDVYLESRFSPILIQIIASMCGSSYIYENKYGDPPCVICMAIRILFIFIKINVMFTCESIYFLHCTCRIFIFNLVAPWPWFGLVGGYKSVHKKTMSWIMIWSPYWYKLLWACDVQTPSFVHHILKVNMQISLHHTHGYPISFIFMQIKCKLYHDHIKFDDDMLSSYSIAYSIIMHIVYVENNAQIIICTTLSIR